MISPRPLIARLGRKLGAPWLVDRAAERVEVSPAIVSDRPAAIALPGEFERAVAFYESRAMELARIAGGRREEGATIAYRLDDVLLAHGALYRGWTGESFRRDAARFVLAGRAARRADGLLATSLMGETYFGDWLIESFGAALVAERLGVPAVGFAARPWLHEAGYQALLGLAAERLALVRFDRLWLLDDRGMNADRAARLRTLRARLRARVARDGPARLFLARGASGRPRDVANADALAAWLDAQGFTVVHPEREEPARLARLLANARIVMTVEGSAQLHALLAMPDDATLLILQPPTRFTAPGKDIADLAGIAYAYLVGAPAGAGFTIDCARLDALLARIEAGRPGLAPAR